MILNKETRYGLPKEIACARLVTLGELALQNPNLTWTQQQFYKRARIRLDCKETDVFSCFNLMDALSDVIATHPGKKSDWAKTLFSDLAPTFDRSPNFRGIWIGKILAANPTNAFAIQSLDQLARFEVKSCLQKPGAYKAIEMAKLFNPPSAVKPLEDHVNQIAA